MAICVNCDIGQADWVRGHVADVFSSSIAAAAISASYELGLLDRLAVQDEVPLDGSGNDEDQLDADVVRAIYRALWWADVVQIKADGSVTRGTRFNDAYAARGYFYWLVRGCGEIVSQAGRVAKVSNRSGDFYRREMSAVAMASSLIGDSEVEPLFDQILADLSIKKLVDLGCGSGRRIIRIANQRKAATCLGIDISKDAISVGSSEVDMLGLAQRVSFLLADVRDLKPDESTVDADIITCVFMGHDFWPYAECVQTMRQLRVAFPAAQRLLLCDVVKSMDSSEADSAIFTLGFEFVHALMGVYLPTLKEWEKAFDDSGWICQAIHKFTVPPNGYLFELAPAETGHELPQWHSQKERNME